VNLQCRSLQQQWLQSVSIKMMDTRYEQYPPVFGGLMEVYLVAPEPVDKNRRSIVGSTKATVESDIRPLHSHTGTPDQWNTERSDSP